MVLKENKVAKGIIKLVIFLCVFFICLNIVNNITKRKDAYNKYSNFFSQKEDFDVLFFGSSHVLNGVYPMYLWKEYGIVSYNMGNVSERLPATYYNIRLALEQKTPKLVVVDAYLVFQNEKIDSQREKIHYTLDAYPISKTKYEAVKDLFDGENLFENEIEFLFPFSMYHSRWSELQDDDLKNNINCEKGADTVSGIIEPTSIPDYDNVKMFEGEETINMHYLRKIIEYCKEKKIEVLVTYLPHTAIDEHVAQSKYVKKICDEYNVNYINFLSDKDIVNYYIDFKDSIKINSHLNASGARKVTEYLGKYITEYYDIPNQKNNKSYDSWNDDYNKYIDFKIKKLASHKENINNYLILLYDEKDIKYKIELSSKMKIEKGSILEQLLENLDNKYEINDEVFKKDEKNKDNTIKITTWDNRNGKVIREVWF